MTNPDVPQEHDLEPTPDNLSVWKRIKQMAGAVHTKLKQWSIPSELRDILTPQIVDDVMAAFYADIRADYDQPTTMEFNIAGRKFEAHFPYNIRIDMIGDNDRKLDVLFAILKIHHNIDVGTLDESQRRETIIFFGKKIGMDAEL